MNSLPLVSLRSVLSQVLTLTLSEYLFQMILSGEGLGELDPVSTFLKGLKGIKGSYPHGVHLSSSYQCVTCKVSALALLPLAFEPLPLLRLCSNSHSSTLSCLRVLLQELPETTFERAGLWLVGLIASHQLAS